MYTICIQGVCFLLTIDTATGEIEGIAFQKEEREVILLTRACDFGNI